MRRVAGTFRAPCCWLPLLRGFVFKRRPVAYAQSASFDCLALNDLTLSFSTFDASQAECYKPEERQTLLAVIERGFGSISGFNSQVRQIIFKGKVKRSATMSFARLPEQSSDEEDGFDSAALEFLGREAAPVRRQKSAGVQETKKRWTGLKTLVKVAPSPRQGPEEAR